MTLNKIFKIASIFLLTSFVTNCKSELDKKDKIGSTNQTSKIEEGFPSVLKSFKKDLPFEIISSANLNSNNDSIKIYFGELKQGNDFGHWLALSLNDTLRTFRTISYNFNSENVKENQFDLEYNKNLKNRISLRISDVDTLQKRIEYSWINNTGLSDTLIVQPIKAALATGNHMKNINLNKLNGEKINLKNLNEDIIVLNWWAVKCAPCIKEMPGLNELRKKYYNKNVRFIAVTNDSKEVVINFLKDHEFDYEMTFISKEDQVVFGNTYPKNLIIDSSNKIAYYSEGGNEDKHKEIESNLIKILRSENRNIEKTNSSQIPDS